MVADPLRPATGVTVTVRSAPAPPRTTVPTGMRVGSLDAAVTTSWPAGVTPSPTANATGPVDPFRGTARSATSETVGGASLVRSNDAAGDPPPATAAVAAYTPLAAFAVSTG